MIAKTVASVLWAIALSVISLASTAASAPDRSHDVIVQKASIPSEKNTHGEVRWIRRGETTCLQTLLYTPSLRRGIDTMKKKEMKAWPSGAAGYADSSRYLTMLETASREALRRFDARKGPSVRLQTMAIEFTVDGNASSFATFMLEIEEHDGEVAIVSLEPVESSAASRAYVARAMRLQAAAAFGSVPKELDDAIGNER